MALTIFNQRYRPQSGQQMRGPWKRMTVCFSAEQMAEIHRVAKRKNCTVAFAIRHLADTGLAVELDEAARVGETPEGGG